MSLPRCLRLAGIAVALGLGARSAETESSLRWPEITRENKPWTRWWWPGSAVDAPNLTRQLERFSAAGLGGVEITPIYGARGAESRYLDFLSPPWIAMLEHTGREAARLHLGLDMATGTGWPFGGPWIDLEHASQTAVLRDGRIVGAPTRMQVKRSAPGGEGNVVDPYSPAALKKYLGPIGDALVRFPRQLVRSQFHDSFEYYHATWTPEFAARFQAMHGYDLQAHAAELLDAKSLAPEKLARLKSDYRETLAALHLRYLQTWRDWSHERGWLVRNQSHGAPANLLDLYATADIAETEIFGSTPFPIPGLRRLPAEVRSDMDLPEPLVMRMAASAAHVAGHNLVSSESCTWLREHWKVALSMTKPELDRLFVNGINHVFYHGTVYSPEDVAWPGWLFYASTQFNPSNPWWTDFGALNAYVARVQSILQRGQPDHDILLYWPIYDLWDNPDGLLQQLAVHDVSWLLESPCGRLAKKLTAGGYGFDFVSDAQLEQTRCQDGALVTPGGRYKIVVVPATRRLPLATLRQLHALAQAGAQIFFEKLPEDVPGLSDLERRRHEFQSLLRDTATSTLVATDILAALGSAPVLREPVATTGLEFVRRKTPAGHDYFFANLTAAPFAGWVALGTPTRSALLFDPLTAVRGVAATRGAFPTAEIFLQLEPGQSVIVRTTTGPLSSNLPGWNYTEPSGLPLDLVGRWTIDFVSGGPELPPTVQTTALKSWTDLAGEEAQRFGGTARYRLEFSAPAQSADDWRLDLGDVRESARVKLNGHDLGTLWSLPFRTNVGSALQPGTNVLEIEITNLAANRIRDLDRRHVDWKIMREINFVDINYRPFDASGWELQPSGLLGPVRLVPLKRIAPH